MARPGYLEAGKASLRAMAPGAVEPPGFSVLAWRNDGGRASGGNCFVILPGVIGAVYFRRTDLRVRRDSVQKPWQDGRITDVAAGDHGGPDFQRFLSDPDMYRAPVAPLGATVLSAFH